MKKYDVLKKIIQSKLTVVIRANSREEAINLSEACIRGGIKSIEITYTTPKASEVIEYLREKHANDVIGAGTILDSETARIAILSGAQFIVSPNFCKRISKLCNRYGIPYLPGCMSVDEVIQALEYGNDIVKLFPAQVYSPSFIKNIKGPIPNVEIMPTGGVNLKNIKQWFDFGALIVGVGGEITSVGKGGDYDIVTEVAKQFTEIVTEV